LMTPPSSAPAAMAFVISAAEQPNAAAPAEQGLSARPAECSAAAAWRVRRTDSTSTG
jgi:hypothetical protein